MSGLDFAPADLMVRSDLLTKYLSNCKPIGSELTLVRVNLWRLPRLS